MKDFTITARRQRTELWMLLASFVVANILNIWAVASYGAPVSEIYSSLFYVLVCTVVIYALTVVVRILAYGIISLWRKIKTKK